ncbi:MULTISPECIES: hypothetical protein [unclassified Frankia]|nr:MULTISPECIES: hypothetical protein [unclassified Frankia]
MGFPVPSLFERPRAGGFSADRLVETFSKVEFSETAKASRGGVT